MKYILAIALLLISADLVVRMLGGVLNPLQAFVSIAVITILCALAGMFFSKPGSLKNPGGSEHE